MRRMRKGIYILPSLATTFNIGLGYYALWHIFSGSAAEPWHFDNAAKAIGFAVVADGIDGRIARMTGTESDFGREFDSLADVITFGVAPALLAWIWGFKQLGSLYGTDLAARTMQLGALVSFAFLIAGACRLARFNIHKNPEPLNPGRPGKRYFVGMPIPAGAGVIAAVVHFTSGQPLNAWWEAIPWGGFVLAAGLLMVSTWRYYSFKDIDFRSRHPFRLIILIAIVIGLIWYASQIVLFVIAIVYMISGIVTRMSFEFKKKREPTSGYQKEAPEAR
ncbi:MAG TPA: phosphatidylcholine/phosphatidylserine synthase [Terriglobales bacterium]|nr:phosphatidylcholine/phosphatidylserine synthase [Terriglobales bacterium]